MCLYNDPHASKVWLEENKDKPFVVVYKRFRETFNGICTPYKLTFVNLSTNELKSNSRQPGGCVLDYVRIERGIHCYSNRPMGRYRVHFNEILVKMHALPEDFLGYDPDRSEMVFTKLYFPDDVWAKLLAKYHPDLCVPEDD